MNVQEFLGGIKVDGDVVADGTVSAKEVAVTGNASAGGNLTAMNVSANGQITADSIRVGTPNRFYMGEKNLSITIGAGTVMFFGCSGTVNTTGTGAKVLYLVGCPSLTVNNNGSAKTYRDGFAVGSIFQTTGTDSPAEAFGGNWEQLTADAYFKIVTSGAGNLGGQENHKIGIPNLPAHNFNYAGVSFNQTQYLPLTYSGSNWIGDISRQTNTIGSDEPYYPYYYGIYAWRRINVSGQE